MFKIINKSINYGLLILAILAFVAPFNTAMAGASYTYIRGEVASGGIVYRGEKDYPVYTSPSYHKQSYNYAPAPISYTVPAPVYYSQPVQAQVIYSTPSKPKQVAAKPKPKYVNPAPTSVAYSNTAVDETPEHLSTTTSVSERDPNEGISDLAASAVFGEQGSFMPSGIVQWILFAIMVLLAVILARKIFGGEAKYFATPMKHD